MKRWKKILIGMAGFLCLLLIAGYIVYGGGKHEGSGVVHDRPLAASAVAERATRQRAFTGKPADGDVQPKQILFGDLHVHSTFSADAFMRSLPLAGGEGAHPPADACDYARFCSALDFFSLTDHAEALTPRHWRETKESIRQCNAVAGDPQNPDLVAFTGFEWSHVGQTPEEHYGHKNVIFRDDAEDRLPVRPIASPGLVTQAFRNYGGLSLWTVLTIPIRDFSRRQRYLDFVTYQRELQAVGQCAAGVDVRELPENCTEIASDPAELFEKLRQWNFDTMVIPHGTTWGFYTPPGNTYDKQLVEKYHDPDLQRLIEVYSGHGNSEEYRPWRASTRQGEEWSCPEPTADYEPCCHRAGELIRARCGDAPAEECERRVAKARADYVAAGAAGHNTVPGAEVADWGDCGQCRDCFNPSFSYRPGGSVQYILARGSFDDPDRPNHVRMGFIASSDNHAARPGTGFKEFSRRLMTEAAGPPSAAWRDRIFGGTGARKPHSRPADRDLPPFRLVDLERQASFFMTGGLVAVHSAGRDRDSIWEALGRREVYGTSGDRILLWFDMVNAPGGRAAMGAEVEIGEAPRFAVRAAGAFVQKPGCPDSVTGELSPERLARICAGECYHPGDRRRRITRIEVVRIRPQKRADEPVAALIEDPWKTLECPPGGDGCSVEFEDPDFVSGGRQTLYYVRAIQEPTPAVNAGNLRCQDESCETVKPCYGDYRTPYGDDCLSDNEERAWSSPIFVDFAPTAVPAPVESVAPTASSETGK